MENEPYRGSSPILQNGPLFQRLKSLKNWQFWVFRPEFFTANFEPEMKINVRWCKIRETWVLIIVQNYKNHLNSFFEMAIIWLINSDHNTFFFFIFDQKLGTENYGFQNSKLTIFEQFETLEGGVRTRTEGGSIFYVSHNQISCWLKIFMVWKKRDSWVNQKFYSNFEKI